jgi:hypothetical protein
MCQKCRRCICSDCIDALCLHLPKKFGKKTSTKLSGA